LNDRKPRRLFSTAIGTPTRRREIPLGRFAEPEDISAVVLFLASDGARHITGATIDVNGGYVVV
jgi:NAD(P)-dependent dehydrogenase (short-subunit alcohol dehydrogenase family)